MPRRKPVNPQPKLKQEDEREDTKTGNRFGEEDEDEPPEKKALTETPDEERAKYDPTGDVNSTTVNLNNDSTKTSKTEMSDVKDIVPDIVKSDDTNLKADDSVKTTETGGQSSSAMKCNQSLQALFEAAHSELQNISKQGDRDAADNVATQQSVVQMSVPNGSDLTSALKSGQIVIIQCDTLDPGKTVGPQVLQQIVMDKKGTGKFHLPAEMSNIELVSAEKPSDHVYGTSTAEVTPGDSLSYKVNEALKPTLAKSTFVIPRMPTETIVAVPVASATTVGRKRKHPQKPGKHICRYCGRGCAKPSVLQKHIRAHTGERPYPCIPCGFSFKTKSNLYKHCKSRAHAIKMGLLTAPPDTGNNSAPKEDKSDEISDESDDDMTPESTAVELKMDKAFVPKPVQGTDQSMEKSSGDSGDNKFLVVQPEGATVETLTPLSASASEKAVIGDCQYYDVTFMTVEGTLQTISLPAQLAVPVVPKTQATTTTSTTPQVIIIKNPDEKLAVNTNTHVEGVATSMKNIVVSVPSVPDCKSFNSVTMKTETNATLLPRQSSFSSNRVRLTPTALPSGDQAPPATLNSNQPISRVSLTPEMLHERITQLISSNAAIVDTPMADAPRPKRVSRHNSMFEPMLVSSSQVSMTTAPVLPSSSAPVLPPEAARKPTKLTPTKSDGSNFLGLVEPSDQPPGSSGKPLSSGSGAGLSYTTTMSTNEIKIQIRLPKPITTTVATSASVNVISSSMAQVGQSGGVTAPVMAVERSVIKDLLLKGRSQSLPSTVVLQTPVGEPVVGEAPSSDGQHAVACAACHQTFYNASLMDEHLKQSCPLGGAVKLGPVYVVMAPEPTLLSPATTMLVTSSVSHVAAITPINVTTTTTKPNLKTHTVVMTTAMTGGSTMLLEVVDPTLPPKRGRPKGSRNSYNSPASKPSPIPDLALFPTYPSLAPRPPRESQPDSVTLKPPGRPPRPVLRLKIPPPHGFATSHVTKGSQSAGVSPGSTSDLPTTPITSFAKLKLKGKILMKRSMSVERMLLQDKPGSVGLSTGSSVSNLPHSSCIQSTQVPQKFLANLRRCESLDESMPLAKRARLQERSDSGKLDSLLYKMLMKGLISSTQAGSTTIIANSVPTVTKPAQPVIPSTTGGNIPDVIVIDDGPTEVDTQLADTSGSSGATTGVVMYPPAKVGMTLASRLGMGNVAPFARGISADVMLHFPSVKSLPDNLVSGIPGRLLRVITGSTLGLDTDSTVEAGAMTHDRDDKGKDEGSSRRTPDSQMAKTDLSEARPDVQRLSTKCSLTRQLSTAEKSAAVQLLLSHSCPILCNRTHVTFCTVVKPQPIYVSQVTERLSMYSNWKTTPTDGQDSKLTSRMMLSLYETHRRTESPYYMNCSRPVSILTHSSYWNGVSSPPPAPPIVTAQCNPPVSELKPASKSSNEPDLFSVALNEVEVTCENVSSETTAAAPGDRIVRMLHESVAPPIDAPKRVVIFSGGYKTSEEYVYIRGRGRGRYVCERCGIRCKKPSMLKKHIRTHTDLRPYHCYYCSFSFKTKGNLTKHMKSKAHHKKCLELGIFPIPTVVDETHIDSSALDQQNQVAEDYRSRILGVSTDDTDGSHVTDDNDGDDDDDDDDDNGDDDEEEDDTESDAEMVIDDEAESVNSRSDVRYTAVVPDGSTEATFLKMKTGAKSESNRDSLTGGSTKFTGQVKGQPPRASIDKEIAASLLDLSKGTEDVCKMSITSTEYGLGHTGKVGKLTPTTWESVSTNHLVNSREDSAAAAECCSPPVGAATDGVPTMSLDEIPDHISPASRVWLDNMKAFCERAHTQRSTAEHEYNIGARFVPPPPLGGVPVKTSTELAANIASVHQTVNSPMTGGPIVGHFIKQDVSLASILSLTLTDTVSSAMALPMMMTQSSPVTSPTACIAIGNGLVTKSGDTCISNSKTVVSKEFVKQTVQHAPLDSVEKVVAMPTVSMTTVTTTMTQPTQTIPFHLLGLHGLPAVVPSEIPLGVLLVTTASTMPSTSSSSSATMVQFVTGDNRAPYEIIPIPGRVNDNSANLVDGKYVCSVCGKTFSKQHQLTLHKNIHYFERPFKCTDCSLSFRTKGHLEKHHKSEGHQLKVKIVERSQAVLVTTTSGTSADNPRPFRCDDCNVAFRIHGHLAKHLRSKLHIMMLEKLGKVPPGAYALIEKNGSFKEVVATDCESSLQCIRQLLVNLESGDSTSHSVCDGDSVTHIPVEINQSAAADAGQTSTVSEGAVNSFVYRRAGEFEKVTNASNDRVTVERKAELIDFGEFVPETDTASQLTGEGCAGLTERVKESEKNRKGGGRGSSVKATVSASEQSEHKCGLCSSSFTDIASLKYHLVTHTELRPHVCEYCDAGFTTAQSLTFHLRTHTQERPYLCGRCGDTFACLSQLQQHLLVHTSQSPGGATQQPPGGATQKSSGGATQQSPSEATQPAAPVVTTATTGHCSEVAQNKQTVLPSSDGNVNQEDAIDDAVCRQKDVSKSNDAGCLSVVESDVIVTRSCVEILSSHTVLSTASRQLQSATSVTMAPLLHSNSGFAVTNNNTIAADGNRCPVFVTAGPSIIVSSSSPSPGQHRENHLSRTPSIQTHKRRCLQRQFALSGEDVAIAAVTTSLSDGNKASCVTTAAIVATPVNDIGQHSSTQEHSYIGLDHTEQSETVPRCSSAVP